MWQASRDLYKCQSCIIKMLIGKHINKNAVKWRIIWVSFNIEEMLITIPASAHWQHASGLKAAHYSELHNSSHLSLLPDCQSAGQFMVNSTGGSWHIQKNQKWHLIFIHHWQRIISQHKYVPWLLYQVVCKQPCITDRISRELSSALSRKKSRTKL